MAWHAAAGSQSAAWCDATRFIGVDPILFPDVIA
jgi:hypothetical protein